MWWLIASMALQAYGSYQQGQAQAADARQNEAIARHNALLAETDRRAAEVKLEEDQLLQLFESEQAIGSARVRAGASGARTDVGAPFKIRAQMGSMFDFMRFRAARKGREGIEDLTQEAASFRARAKQFGERAKSAERAGLLGTGGAILGGLGIAAKGGVFSKPTTSTITSGSRTTGTFRGL